MYFQYFKKGGLNKSLSALTCISNQGKKFQQVHRTAFFKLLHYTFHRIYNPVYLISLHKITMILNQC